jgi:LysR family glycine cleavage system transcriptional activator
VVESLPSLNALRAFEAVARHLSFTKAAGELCVTQGAVSRQVRNLEEELGVALFSRVPNHLRLTPDGEHLFRSTHAALKQIRDAKKTIQRKSTKLRIITAPTFATRWLIPRLYRFQEKNPKLQIQLETSVKRIDFRYHSDFDAAITYGRPVGGPDLVKDHLFQEKLCPACSPKLMASPKPLKTIQDLCRHCLLHSSLDRTEWKAWAKMMGIGDFQSAGDQCFELEESTIQAAKLGSGIALVNIYYVQDELASEKLIRLFSKIPLLSLDSYYFVYHHHKSSLTSLKKFQVWLFKEMTSFLETASFLNQADGIIKPRSQPRLVERDCITSTKAGVGSRD